MIMGPARSDQARRIRFVRERCEGAGWCSRVAPAYFGRDAEGLAVLLRSTVDEADESDLQSAADMCPTGSIELNLDPPRE
jgi:ferredoxin